MFRHLQELFKIDAADYMLSICGNDALWELSSPGKSGSVFYLSHNDRFSIHIQFDLKGSSQGRSIDKVEIDETC